MNYDKARQNELVLRELSRLKREHKEELSKYLHFVYEYDITAVEYHKHMYRLYENLMVRYLV